MTKYSRILSYPATRVNEFKTTPTQPLYLHCIMNNIGSSPRFLTQFPIVLLRVKTPPFLLQFFRRVVSNRVVTIYNRYFGNDKGWGLFEAWRCINLLLYEA